MIHGLDNSYLYKVCKLTVQLSDGTNSIQSQGTGFFVAKEGMAYLVTNRHVIEPGYSDSQYAAYQIKEILFEHNVFDHNTKKAINETCKLKSYELKFAAEDKDDIACLWKMELVNTPTCNINGFDYSMLACKSEIEDKLSVCDFLVFIGYPVVYDHLNNMPILRSGVVSSDPRLDYSLTNSFEGHKLAYEGFSTNGASGSPVFAIQKGFQVDGEFLKVSDGFFRPIMLVGINAESIKSNAVHQQMSMFYKSSYIRDLIDSCK